MSLEKYQEAVNAFNKILNDENGNPIPEIIMTDTEGNIGEFQVRFHEVSYERGLAYFELKSWNLAIDDFRRCIQNNYLVPESRYMCGAIYVLNTRWLQGKAIKWLRKEKLKCASNKNIIRVIQVQTIALNLPK